MHQSDLPDNTVTPAESPSASDDCADPAEGTTRVKRKQGNTSRRERVAAERYEQERRALDLRRDGVSYPAIAEQLGVAVSTAHGRVHAALDRLRQEANEAAADILRIELERLDLMLARIAPQILAGNLGAIDRALRIMERRAKYLGLDAPVRAHLEHTGRDGGPIRVEELTDEQLRAERERLQAIISAGCRAGDPES